jgi:peptidyl-prolyl cis-trans isomerase C
MTSSAEKPVVIGATVAARRVAACRVAARHAALAPAILYAALACAAVALSPAARADTAPDPVVARVNGQPILLSDVKEAASSLPPSARSMPEQTLLPLVLQQIIDGKALIAEARKTGLDKDPVVQRQIQAAEDQALQTALLKKEVAPQVSEEAVRARYEKDIAGKAGVPEVHARHILVSDEATAKKIIAELKKGGDFAALSKQYSKDPGAASQGGDLGWFKQGEMVPEFSKAAFALKDGEVSPEPIHTQFGWHVIQTLQHRDAPAPDFDQAKQELRQTMIQEAVKNAVAQARADVKVETFNLDGSPIRATDGAEPPPAPAKP